MKISPLVVLAPAAAAGVLPRSGSAKALYFLDNNPAGASVVSLKISSKDGTLSDPVRTSTGGVGRYGMTAMGVGAGDTLFSQDAVVVAGKRLLTVNPGSNTISLFTIPADDPTHPVLVGKPQSTVGEFPNAVAFSHDLHLACAVTTGAKGGVACFHVTDAGLQAAGAFMPLPINETTPPIGPPNTASDIVFNPSSTALFVTVKGDGTNPGTIAAFPVRDGAVSPHPVISRPAGLLLDFSLSFLDDARAVVTDPAYGASFIDINPHTLQATVAKKVVVPGQAAICWSQYEPRFDAVYLFDGGHPNITVLDPATGATRYVIPGPAAAMGSFDSVVSGDFLYVLQGAAGVSVYALAGSRGHEKVPWLVQSLDLSSLGARTGWQGLAVYC